MRGSQLQPGPPIATWKQNTAWFSRPSTHRGGPMASPFKQNKASFSRSANLPTPSLSFPPRPEAPATLAKLGPTPDLAVQNFPRPEVLALQGPSWVLEHRPRCTFPILWPHVVSVTTAQLCFVAGSCRHRGVPVFPSTTLNGKCSVVVLPHKRFFFGCFLIKIFSSIRMI